MKKIQRFFMNAMIMTVVSLLMNGAGVWFNLYISGKIGAEGMGVFQLILSVYSFAVTFASSGISLAATRLVAEETALPNGDPKGAMRRCLCYAALFGGASSVLLFFAAPYIGVHFLGHTQTIFPLKAMALSMPFYAMSCALGGYFTAVGRVVKSASAQILEQAVKMTLAMIGLNFLMPPGLEYACLAITGSGAIAEGISFFYAWILYQRDSRDFRHRSIHAGKLTGRLLGIALPVAVSSYLRSGLATVKHLLVPTRLQAAGLAAGASYAVFGALHGVALPVILFPAAFLNSFSNLIVPEIAQRHSRGQNCSHLIQRMFTLNLCCSFGVCGVLFAFSHEIGAAVSTNPDVGIYIRLLAPVVPVMYLDTAVDCMLKGLNEQVSVMRYNVVDAAVSMVLVYSLLPIMGIKGYVLVVILSEVLNFALSLGRLIRVAKFELDLTEWVIKPFLSIAIAVMVVRLLPFGRSGAVLQAGMRIAAAAVGYFMLLCAAGCDPRRV